MSQSLGFEWWRGGVIYQIYPRSYCDSNGDGVGDLPGITSKIPYIASLGVDAIWLSPFFKSPMKDFGYDVSDYCAVDPLFGRLEDFKALLATAHEHGLKVIIDQVYSHTSIEHPWFEESRQSRDNDKADWYVWADAKPDGTPPNNWLSIFGGPAWQWDSRRKQYYMHNFLTSQPDLNFHNPAVQDAVLAVAKFWLDIGVDGFRLDVVNMYFHDQHLRDNPVAINEHEKFVGASEDNPWSKQYHCYQLTRPENLGFLRRLRQLMDQYPDRFTVGEIGAPEGMKVMAAYTQGNDKLHSSYTFELLGPEHSVSYLSQTLENVDANLGDGWPCFALSNHDVERSVSRWADGRDPQAFAKLSLAFLLSLRGSACIYQGEELGFSEAELSYDQLQDPFGIEFWPEFKGRDGCRTPIAWNQQGGFSSHTQSWLPVVDSHRQMSVEHQEQDIASVLNFSRRFLQWRRQQPLLWRGAFRVLSGEGDLLVFERFNDEGQVMRVMMNFSAQPRTITWPQDLTLLYVPGFECQLEDGSLTIPGLQSAYGVK